MDCGTAYWDNSLEIEEAVEQDVDQQMEIRRTCTGFSSCVVAVTACLDFLWLVLMLAHPEYMDREDGLSPYTMQEQAILMIITALASVFNSVLPCTLKITCASDDETLRITSTDFVLTMFLFTISIAAAVTLNEFYSATVCVFTLLIPIIRGFFIAIFNSSRPQQIEFDVILPTSP